MGGVTLGQVILSFISTSGVTLVAFIIVAVKTSGSRDQRIIVLERDTGTLKTDVAALKEKMAAITGTANGVKLREGGHIV